MSSVIRCGSTLLAERKVLEDTMLWLGLPIPNVFAEDGDGVRLPLVESVKEIELNHQQRRKLILQI